MAAAAAALFLLAGCGAGDEAEDLEGDLGNPGAQQNQREQAEPAGRPDVPAGPEAQAPAASFPGIAGDAGIAWEDCNPTETTTDWVGNTFDWTLCWTPDQAVVSFYQYDSSQAGGMRAEYVVDAHITDTWGVAADSLALLEEIVANLRAAGYPGS